MNKKKCIVIEDFVGCAGIVVKKGIVSEVLQIEPGKSYIWINPYIEEVGEEIPFPIFESYVRYI